MTIRYSNGLIREGVVLSRQDNVVRVAMCGHEDVCELYLVNGRWIAEDCQPVEIEEAWDAAPPTAETSEEDFLCSREEADLLLNLIRADDQPPSPRWSM